MKRFVYHRSLLSGLLGAAVIVAAACSGSDRTVAGRDTTQTANIDSAAVDTQSTAVGTVPGADSGAATASRSTQPPDTPTRDTAVESKDQTTPGYQAMQEPAGAGDTSSRDTDSAEVAGAAATSRIATDAAAARADTVAVSDSVAGQAESDRVRPPEDSSETLGAVTGTDTATVSVEADTIATAVQEDTIAAHADTSMAVVHTDTSTADQQLEVAVDSTEVLGNVTNQEQEAEPEPTDANADAAAVTAAVQTTGKVATGAEAVSLMSRGGQPCTVVTGDKSEDAEWDMASSPATMNPCGTGTMTLPRVQLEKEAAQ